MTPDLNLQHQSSRRQFYTFIQRNSNHYLLDFHEIYPSFTPLMLLRGWIFMFSRTSWPLLVVILVHQYFQLYSRYLWSIQQFSLNFLNTFLLPGGLMLFCSPDNKPHFFFNKFIWRLILDLKKVNWLASSPSYNPIWTLRQQKNCLKKRWIKFKVLLSPKNNQGFICDWIWVKYSIKSQGVRASLKSLKFMHLKWRP